ncbi:MAG: type II toxin-antitoxin system HicA family toxin [Planctomycetota bacterium]|nr:type II toxin-antitoxin system HicA family toxin [Planctomycetota bacterium]
MQRTELERHLRDHGCGLHHHGAKHDVWINPENMRKVSVPRHRVIKKGTVRGICRRLDIPSPPGL